MPLSRVRNTFCQHSNSTDQDAVMSDVANTTTSMAVDDNPVYSSPLAPSRSVNGSTSLGKRRRRQEGQPSERASKRIAAMKSSSTTTPNVSPGEISTPVVVSPTHTSIPDTSPPSTKPNLSLNHINNTPTSTSQYSEPASPAPTEIEIDTISHIEQSPEDNIETLRAAGIKVRDFAYESTIPNSSKPPEVFDPVPCLIAADWHMRNPSKNFGLLSPKALFRLIKMGWLTLTDVRQYFNPYEYVGLAHYNDQPEEKRYPFVVSHKEAMPTPSQRVRLRRQAGLATDPYDYKDERFFGYNPTGYSDDEGGEEGPPGEGGRPPSPPRAPTPPLVPAETILAVVEEAEVEAEIAEAAVVEEESAKPKRRKAKGTTKKRSRAKPKRPKPLRRECSRPEV